jgi:hypothetical protein
MLSQKRSHFAHNQPIASLSNQTCTMNQTSTMNNIFVTPRSETCTQCLSPPPQRNLLHMRSLDGKDDSFSAPMMPTMDDDDNVSFAGMLPRMRLSRRNADCQPSRQSSNSADDMPELPDLVDTTKDLRLMPTKSISSASDFSFPRPIQERSNSLIFIPKAA